MMTRFFKRLETTSSPEAVWGICTGKGVMSGLPGVFGGALISSIRRGDVSLSPERAIRERSCRDHPDPSSLIGLRLDEPRRRKDRPSLNKTQLKRRHDNQNIGAEDT
mmetsp:Transcript_47277/g.93289  ORF Transcript_47277/g.93289 Transcript_47277/m.93289 type:complete len:107 (+) Transcript_47277:792-1112(+)